MNLSFLFQAELYYYSAENFYKDSGENTILETSRKLSIFLLMPIFLVGLFGHSLIILVFGQKRFRKNSSNVFVFSLAINDSLYLISHFFEDILRTFQDVYVKEENSLFNKFIIFVNIADKFDFSCRLIVYMKFILCFISAYILVVITMQRVLVIFKPMKINYFSKLQAWYAVLLIIFISFILNIWVPFTFELNHGNNSNSTVKKVFCNVALNFASDYFLISQIFILLTVIVPSLIIFIGNLTIIINLYTTESKRKSLTNLKTSNNILLKKSYPTAKNSTKNDFLKVKFDSNGRTTTISEGKIKPFYLSLNNFANRTKNSINDSKNSSKILLLISSLFLLFNFPYLVVWILIFHKNHMIDTSHEPSLFAAFQLCKTIYHLNFITLFFVYCAAGSKFRTQLKNSCKFLFQILSNANFLKFQII